LFNSDEPLKSYDEDILNRASFSRNLAEAILSYNEENSIAVALYGPWGSGKTSIINMSLEYINEISSNYSKDEKPIIIKFNPWYFSDQNQLISKFFDQLSNVLQRKDYAKGAKKAGELIEEYSNILTPLYLVPKVGPIMKGVNKLGAGLKKWGKSKSKDLNSIKEELNNLLAEQKHKIIIVIDDIDRLNDKEIRQIFQLIKSLGDFPNTVYYLAFDKEVVINALNKVQEGSGEEYLEKVVQVPFDIPQISEQQIEKMLFFQLDKIIERINQERWNSKYWGNIYFSGLKYLFKNIRDVTRFINALRFNFSLIKDEVNPVDFIAITAIQIFIPKLYYGIRNNKDVFAGAIKMGYRDHNIRERQKEKIKSLCDDIIDEVSYPSREVLEELLKRLFPKLESVYGNTNYGSDWLDNWRRDCRVCSPDIFDVYFKLSLPEGEISRKRIEKVISLSNELESFNRELIELNNEEKIERFLERFEDYTEDIDNVENIENIIMGLIDLGDLFPKGKRGFTSIDNPMRILRITYQLLHNLDSKEERFIILKKSIQKATQSLYTIVHRVGVLDQEHGKYDKSSNSKPKNELTVNADQLEKLEENALKKIEEWAEKGKLRKHRDLASILFSWRRWGDRQRVKTYAKNLIENDEGLIDFITGFLYRITSQGMRDYVAEKSWKINLENVEEFVDLNTVKNRLEKIRNSKMFKKLGDKEQIAVKIFLKTFNEKINKNE